MYMHTAELLGQPLPVPGLPDWMRLYLRRVDDHYRSFTHLFVFLWLHPSPMSVETLSPLANKITTTFEKTPGFLWDELRSEVRRIRRRRQQQDKDFSQLLVKHLEIFLDVVKSFKTFKPEDLEPFLIAALLTSPHLPGSPNREPPFLRTHKSLWNLGKRFVKEKLPKELSRRVTESPWYMQEVINAVLANSLFVMARAHEFRNAAFKKKVEIEEKARAKRS
jgi:hypothetical protein